MDFWTQFKKWTQDSLFKAFEKNAKDNAEMIVPAVQEVSQVLLDIDEVKKRRHMEANSELVDAIKELPSQIKFPEIVIPKHEKTDISPLISVIKEELSKIGDKKVIVKNDISSLVDFFKGNSDKKELIEALRRIENRIPELGEQIDYSSILSQISTDILGDKYGEKLDKIIEAISTLEFPSVNLPLTKDGKLKVEGDPKWIGGGGLDKYLLDVYSNRINPSTSDNQTNGLQKTQVTNFPDTQPVSVSSLPLPNGAATSDKQDEQTSNIQDLYTRMGYLLDRLDYGLITDNSKQLYVSLGKSAALSTVSTVTGVTTVSTLTNQARIGDVQAQRVVEAQMDTAFNLGITNNISF